MVRMNDPEKFAEFDRMIAEAKQNGIQAEVVPNPQTLGDTYDELVMNLDKLAAAELSLVILPPSRRR